MSKKMKELIEKLEKAATVEEINSVKAEIEAEKVHEAAIAEKSAILEGLKGAEQKVEKKIETCKTLGEFASKNLVLDAVRSGAAKSAGTNYGFKAASDVHMSTPMQVVSQNVVDLVSQRNLAIRALFGSESINGTSIKYFVLGSTEGAPTTVAEGDQKPQFHVPYDSKTASLQKIAGWYYETDELIEDNTFLRSSIDNRGFFELDQAVETYLMTKLLGTSGIQTLSPAGSALTADDIFKAMMNVKSATNYDADAIVINPTDYQALRLAKDSNLQYYGGGYFYGAYGNTTNSQQPNLWGVNTVVTTAVSAGTVLVGAFRPGASVITKSGDGVRVEVVTGDHDDRTHNRVTVIVEERLLLATRIPSAFVKIA